MDQTVREQFQASQSKDRRAIAAADPNRLAYHLMPPVGWLNDPNGLCVLNGTTHIFYQYTPERPDGHDHRGWGHYTTKDYIHYQEENDPFVPDTIADAKGSYSGSALVENGTMHLFFTGNNKLPGDFDYINEGRTHWTLHSTSKDGLTFTPKEVLMKNEDYPSNLSCHVRDPKLLKKQDAYYMVLGARTKDSQGRAEIFKSTDLHEWKHASSITPEKPFGYMWECPDLFELEGRYLMICCPQGVRQQGIQYENVYQNGWFEVSGDLDCDQKAGGFHELDHGFDFYAPQSFQDESGRRILIGWMGMPDCEYTNPTVDYAWQHALTLPRKLLFKNGQLHQFPIEELQALRKSEICFDLASDETIDFESKVLELDLHPQGDAWTISFRQDCKISYENGILSLSFGKSGFGRTVRHAAVKRVESLQIFSDTSSIELFVNGGEAAMTSRVYDQEDGARLSATCPLKGCAWELGSFSVTEKLDKTDPSLN